MNNKLSILEKIAFQFNKLTKNDTIEELETLVRVIAIGIWADKNVHELELVKATEIIDASIKDKSDANLVKRLITERINTYKTQNWVFQKERDEVLTVIFENRQWDYAEYMVEMFKADNVVTEDEDTIMSALSKLIEAKKFFEAKLGIKVF